MIHGNCKTQEVILRDIQFPDNSIVYSWKNKWEDIVNYSLLGNDKVLIKSKSERKETLQDTGDAQDNSVMVERRKV